MKTQLKVQNLCTSSDFPKLSGGGFGVLGGLILLSLCTVIFRTMGPDQYKWNFRSFVKCLKQTNRKNTSTKISRNLCMQPDLDTWHLLPCKADEIVLVRLPKQYPHFLKKLYVFCHCHSLSYDLCIMV